MPAISQGPTLLLRAQVESEDFHGNAKMGLIFLRA